MGLRRRLALAAALAAGLATAADADITYDAVVAKDGTLTKGNAASSFRASKGTYIVQFLVTMTNCAYVGTLGRATMDGGVATPPGMITVVRAAGFSKGVYVQTFDRRGNIHDMPFHLFVAC